MDESEFKDILIQMKHEFTKNIMEDLYKFSYYEGKENGFLNLKLYSREFRLQQYMEVRAETYIRNFLLNGVICTALERIGVNITKITPSNDICDPISTEELEKLIGFEFVIDDGTTKTGIRYTDFAEDDFSIIDKFDIDEIYIIDKYVINTIDEENYKWLRGIPDYKVPCEIISLGEFLYLYFGKESAIFYINNIRKTIHDYQITVSTSSFSRLTPPKLFEFRLKKGYVITHKVGDIYNFFDDSPIKKRYIEYYKAKFNKEPVEDSDGIGYKVIEKSNLENYVNLEERSRNLLKKEGILDQFENYDCYKIFIGKSDLAKSYLTSEYMFSRSSKNDLFDYTTIISGYVKSIEQLLFKIALFYVDKGYKIGDPLKNFSTNNLKNGMSLTMGNLCYFLRNNKETTRIQDKNTLFDCIECYTDECRNDSFHRHNIHDWDRVNIIRNNTLLLYILLLGSCNLGEDANEISKHFEIFDDSLERIYYEIREHDLSELYIKPKNEEFFIRTIRQPEIGFPKFDNNGFLVNFKIKCKCEDPDFPQFNGRVIKITRNNIPDKIYYGSMDDPWEIEY